MGARVFSKDPSAAQLNMAPEPGSDELFRKESGMKLKDSFLN